MRRIRRAIDAGDFPPRAVRIGRFVVGRGHAAISEDDERNVTLRITRRLPHPFATYVALDLARRIDERLRNVAVGLLDARGRVVRAAAVERRHDGQQRAVDDGLQAHADIVAHRCEISY